MTLRLLATSVAASFALLIGGCTISFPQVDSVIDLVQAELESLDTSEPPEDVRWSGSYNGTGRLMTPYLQEDLTVFVSDEGDAIAFDGWLVRSLGGFEQEKIIRVNDDENQRIYNKGGARSIGGCGSWVNATSSDGGIAWTQSCEAPYAKNIIRLNEAGLIVEIDQVVDGAGGRVTLKKL